MEETQGVGQWKPTEENLQYSYWLTFAELEDRFENGFKLEEELSEKVSFFENQMKELGFDNYSDRKFRRKI